MKNRLRIAYHTTKRVQSELQYEHSILLAKELNVMVGSTQLGREACAEMRKTFADGILKKQREFFAKPDKYTKALKLVSGGADEVTRQNRQFSIDTVTVLDDDNMPKCGLLAVTELQGDASAKILTSIGERAFNRVLQQQDEDVIKKRVVGVCYDGASTYQGEFNGVGENYRKKNRNIKNHRDRMHVEGCALKKVLAEEKQYEKITVLITDVRGYIGKSPKRQKSLEKLHKQLHDLEVVEQEVAKITDAIAKTRQQAWKFRRIHAEFSKVMKTINGIDKEIETLAKEDSCHQILQEQVVITKRLSDYIKSQNPGDSANDVTKTLEEKIEEYNNKIESLQSRNPKFEALRRRKSVHTYKLLKFFKIRMVNALKLAIRAIIRNFKPLVKFFETECKRKWGNQEAHVKQCARATKILARLKDLGTVVNMLSLYDLTITLSKTSKLSQYPVLSILMKQQINEYYEKILKTSLSNKFGAELRSNKDSLQRGTFQGVKLSRNRRNLKFIKARQNRAISIINNYVTKEFELSEYEEAAQIFVPAVIRMNMLDNDQIVEHYLPLLYEEQRSWITSDLSVIKLEWKKLHKMLLHSRLNKFKPLEINQAYKVIRDDDSWRCQVPNILRMVEVLQLQPIGCVQCERAASVLKRVLADSRSNLSALKVEYEMRVIMDGAELHSMDVNFYSKEHSKKKRSYQQVGDGQVLKRLKSKESKYLHW